MDFRSASVVIDEIKLLRVVSAHLSASILALNVDDEHYFENPLMMIDILIDGKTEIFSPIYVLAEINAVSGVILQRSIINEDNEELNQLMQVFVSFTETGIAPLQQVATMMETYAVHNRAVTTQKGIELLLD